MYVKTLNPDFLTTTCNHDLRIGNDEGEKVFLFEYPLFKTECSLKLTISDDQAVS